MHHWESGWDNWLHQRRRDSQPPHCTSYVQKYSARYHTENIQDGRSSSRSPAHLSCPHSHWFGHRPIEKEYSSDHHIETRSLCISGGHSFPHQSGLHSHFAHHISSEEGCSGDLYTEIPQKVCMSLTHSPARHCCPCSRRRHCTRPTSGCSGSLFYS